MKTFLPYSTIILVVPSDSGNCRLNIEDKFASMLPLHIILVPTLKKKKKKKKKKKHNRRERGYFFELGEVSCTQHWRSSKRPIRKSKAFLGFRQKFTKNTFHTWKTCVQQRLRPACDSAQSKQFYNNFHYPHLQALGHWWSLGLHRYMSSLGANDNLYNLPIRIVFVSKLW